MSASDDVMQKKSHDMPVVWREYEALRDHLTITFTQQHEALDNSVQGIELKLGDTENAIKEIKTQVTDLQAGLTTLTQSVNAIRLALEQPNQDDFDDADSVHNGNEDMVANVHGRGRGHARGHGFVPVDARRAQVPPQQEDPLGKPRFSIPSFDGEGDVEDYLTWELKIEKL